MKWIRINESEENDMRSKIRRDVLDICDNIEKRFSEYAFKDSYATQSYASVFVADNSSLYEYVPEIYRLIGFGVGKMTDRGLFEYWHGWKDYSEFEKGLEDFKKNRLDECVDWICDAINEKRRW